MKREIQGFLLNKIARWNRAYCKNGIVSRDISLLIFVIIFAPCHILISYMNAILK